MLRMLVAVDGSEGARRAAAYAARTRRTVGEMDIHLLNVQEPPIHYGMLGGYLPPDVMQKLQTEAGDRALRGAERLLRRLKIPYSRHMRVGPVARTIVDTAEELGCDGIVMGTRGMSAVANLVMGSQPTKVIHLSRLPVTLVPGHGVRRRTPARNTGGRRNRG